METGSRKWGGPTAPQLLFADRRQAWLRIVPLIMARPTGRWIACAIIPSAGSDRVWPQLGRDEQHHPFLSLPFEVCYYQAIELLSCAACKTVEAGAQASSKIARDISAQTTYSAHYKIADHRSAPPISDYLRHERPMLAEAARTQRSRPFRKTARVKTSLVFAPVPPMIPAIVSRKSCSSSSPCYKVYGGHPFWPFSTSCRGPRAHTL